MSDAASRRSARIAAAASRKTSSTTTGGSNNAQQPDTVASSHAAVANGGIGLDWDDYNLLKQRYLEPRIRENAQLGGGMHLRKQTAPAIINRPGYLQLKKRIDLEQKSNNDKEIYRLLHQLREWEIHAGRMPRSMMQQEEHNDDVCEVVDLTTHDQDAVIDVDKFISNVLLVKVKEEPDPSRDIISARLSPLADVVTSAQPIPTDGRGSVSGGKAQPERTAIAGAQVVASISEANDGQNKTAADTASTTRNRQPSINEAIDVDAVSESCQRKLIIPKWTRAQDDELCAAVSSYSETNHVDWPTVASHFSNKTTLQCMQRYQKLGVGEQKNVSFAVTRARAKRNAGTTTVASFKNESQEMEESTPDIVASSPAARSSSSASIVTPEKRPLSENASDSVTTRASSRTKLTDYYDAVKNDSAEDGILEVSTRLSTISQSTLTDTDRESVISEVAVVQEQAHAVADKDDAVVIESKPMARQGGSENCAILKTDEASTGRRRLWTPDEDALLREAVENDPQTNWSTIALDIPGRSDLHCRARWYNHLDPTVNRGQWTDSEDRKLLAMHAEIGTKWTEIASRLGTGRTAYHAHKQFQHLQTKQRNTARAEGQNQVVTTREQKKRKRNDSRPKQSKKEPTGVLPIEPQPSEKANMKNNGSIAVEDEIELLETWKAQSRQRRKGDWRPTGGWKPPKWACRSSAASLDMTESSGASSTKAEMGGTGANIATRHAVSTETKPKSSPSPGGRAMAAHVSELIAANLIACVPKENNPKKISSLADVKYPSYQRPTDELLTKAHTVLRTLLPEGDCDCIDVVRLARQYYDYWRPEPGRTRVILLAESHAFTGKDIALSTHLESSVLASYKGPRNFVSLVYCLAYGENEAVATSKMADDASQEGFVPSSNKGTPQFWSLLAACSRGTDFVPPETQDKSVSKHKFAADILKGGGLKVDERLRAKLSILENLKERGIWLLDASVIGWYISQPQKYRRSKVTNEVHRAEKERPPKALKAPSLVVSWEMFTKHAVRSAADEGNLQLLVPIGKEVEASLTRERLQDAVSVAGRTPARVTESFPAPNAWIPGGYGPFFAELSRVANEVAPPTSAFKSENNK